MAEQSTHNYRKHTHKNPIEKFLIGIFYQIFFREIKKLRPKKILDVGAGEGFTMKKLRDRKIGKEVEGIEYTEEAIKLGKKIHPNLHIVQGDIHALPYPENSFDMVICTEVLEHVTEPAKALAELVRVSSKYIVLSVPNEPFFMLGNLARGKNLTRFGNDIEHINHWTFWGFRSFVSKEAKVMTLRIPFFWTMIIARKRK